MIVQYSFKALLSIKVVILKDKLEQDSFNVGLEQGIGQLPTVVSKGW